MDNYENLYYLLFNRISDIIEELKSIQQLSEDLFITFPQQTCDVLTEKDTLT